MEDATAEDSGRLLARLTELTVGAATIDPQTWNQPFALVLGTHARAGGRGRRRPPLAAMTEQLRALDREHGGGACRDAVLAH